jgi:hypothetical protein
MKSATAQIEMQDIRARRARSLAHEVFREIEDLLPQEVSREALHRLMLVFTANGASLLTDQDRAEMGLEPRDGLGWTPSERIRFHDEKISAMHALSRIVFPINSD